MVKNSGFSVVELMIVVAIAAILVVLALPSYQDSVRKGRRADAQSELIQFASSAERIFTRTNSYTSVALPADTEFYAYTFPVAVTDTTFTIRATPTAIQDEDRCGTMTLTQTGQRTHTGTQADCW